MRLPASSSLPSPAARILPFCGFSLAVSGSTRPLAVVSSSSIARTIRRSPRGLSFILGKPPSRECYRGSDPPCGAFKPPGTLAGECQPRGQYIEDSGETQGPLALLHESANSGRD